MREALVKAATASAAVLHAVVAVAHSSCAALALSVTVGRDELVAEFVYDCS